MYTHVDTYDFYMPCKKKLAALFTNALLPLINQRQQAVKKD